MRAPETTHPTLARQERVRTLLEERKLQYLVVSNLTNVFYLTGFRGSAGVVLIGRDEGVLLVDPRYTLQAREQAEGLEVREERGKLFRACGRWLARRRAREVGFDDWNLTYAAWRELGEAAGRRCRLRPCGGMIEEFRMVKDPTEIGLIRAAAQLTSRVFEDVRELIRPGASEADLAAEIDYRLRRQGAEGVAFETIVASGPRSAFPHARASANLLKKNEFAIFDMGAIMGGYAADMTRTIYLGTPSRRARRVYDAVLEAQQQAMAAIKVGERAERIDSVARAVLARRGLDQYFRHSTGHGLGLDIHERPRLGRGEKQRLKAGCVLTVEPGVYLEGFGGVRIEDTVLVGAQGAEVLTSASKQDWMIC